MMMDSERLGVISAEISAEVVPERPERPESLIRGSLTLNGSNLERSDEMKPRKIISSLGPNLPNVNTGEKSEFRF